MSRRRANRHRLQGDRTTLGRLGGLAPGEADRGEKALWLSGGGYRAALFHLGALTRLNELGLLAQIGTVGAVSGGSILAALLATRVPWPLQGAYRDWPERVAEPMRAIARRNARARAFLRRPLGRRGAEAALEERYARELVESLGGESERGPRFVFGASGPDPERTRRGLGGVRRVGARRRPPTARLRRRRWSTRRSPRCAPTSTPSARPSRRCWRTTATCSPTPPCAARGLAGGGGIETAAAGAAAPALDGRGAGARGAGGQLAADRRSAACARGGRGRRERRPEPGSRRADGAAGAPPAAAPVRLAGELPRRLGRRRSAAWSRPGRCNTPAPRRRHPDRRRRARAATRPRLELDFLRGGAYPNGEPAAHGDYLDECGGSHAADALAMRARRASPTSSTAAPAATRAGALWLQYWLFFYYDDKGLLGSRAARGRLGDGAAAARRATASPRPRPSPSTAAPSGCAGTSSSWRRPTTGQAPVVYPARGSHAPRPRPGTYPAPVVPDHNDGVGAAGAAAAGARSATTGRAGLLWPGRWGSTRRRESLRGRQPARAARPAALVGPGGAAPRSAALAGAAAATDAGGAAAGRGSRRAARASWRSSPTASPSRRADGRAGADRRRRRSTRRGEPGPPTRSPVEGLEGYFTLQLPSRTEWTGVRASAASDRGVPGETIAAIAVGEEGERAG